MNDQDYVALRKVGDGIREDAVARQDGDMAVQEFRKVTEFMFDAIHRGGQDISIGAPQNFAACLETLAAQVDKSTPPRSRERLRDDLAKLVEQYTRTCGDRFNGMASLGEDLLMSADVVGDNTVSWAGLLSELKRRSG